MEKLDKFDPTEIKLEHLGHLSTWTAVMFWALIVIGCLLALCCCCYFCPACCESIFRRCCAGFCNCCRSTGTGIFSGIRVAWSRNNTAPAPNPNEISLLQIYNNRQRDQQQQTINRVNPNEYSDPRLSRINPHLFLNIPNPSDSESFHESLPDMSNPPNIPPPLSLIHI